MVTLVPLLHFILFSNILFHQIGSLFGAEQATTTTLLGTESGQLKLLSAGKKTWQSQSDFYFYWVHVKTYMDSKYGNDGDKRQNMSFYSYNACTMTISTRDPFWIVYLGKNYRIKKIIVYGRVDECCNGTLIGTKIEVLQGFRREGVCGEILESTNNEIYTFECDLVGDLVMLRKVTVDGFLALCEVEVFGKNID